MVDLRLHRKKLWRKEVGEGKRMEPSFGEANISRPLQRLAEVWGKTPAAPGAQEGSVSVVNATGLS